MIGRIAAPLLMGLATVGILTPTVRHDVAQATERVAVAEEDRGALVLADIDSARLFAQNDVDAGASASAGSADVVTPTQAIAAGEEVYQEVEHGDYWPLLALIPFAVMFGLRLLHQRNPNAFTALMAHPVSVVALGAVSTAGETLLHAAISGHAIDKPLLEHTAAAFGAVLFAWYQKQTAPLPSPNQIAAASGVIGSMVSVAAAPNVAAGH